MCPSHASIPTPSVEREETCTSCYAGLGFSQILHVDHPLRLGNYSEQGGGQLCPSCALRIYPPRMCIDTTLLD